MDSGKSGKDVRTLYNVKKTEGKVLIIQQVNLSCVLLLIITIRNFQEEKQKGVCFLQNYFVMLINLQNLITQLTKMLALSN